MYFSSSLKLKNLNSFFFFQPSEAELLQVASGLATQDDNVSLDGSDMSALDDEDDDEEENLSPEESAAAAQAALEEDDDDSEDEEKDAEDETELSVDRRRKNRGVRRARRARRGRRAPCSKRFWAKKWRRCGRRKSCRRR